MNLSELPAEVRAMIARTGMPDYAEWRRLSAATGGCANPIRIRGGRVMSDAATGEVLDAFHTDDTPLGYLLLPCGNRRVEVCPACAETYRWDAYQLIRAGLVGGKGVPASVAEHPMLFVTLTAPSFGPVHTRHKQTGRDGKPLRCRVRRKAPTCPHGVTMACGLRHEQDDLLVGQALCPDCYDYVGAVLFNAHAGDLWRRLCIYLRRELAAAIGIPRSKLAKLARLSFVKVAEYQARGVVHFHAVLRVDGPDGPHDPAPGWATVILLDACLRNALSAVRVELPGTATTRRAYTLRFGAELDTQAIHVDAATVSEGLSTQAVAFYIAKYATKAAEAAGSVPRPIKNLAELEYMHLPPHTDRMIRACFALAADFSDVDLTRSAHMLGYRGYCTTKSRHYSTTFGQLRGARRAHRDAQRRQRLGLPSLDGRQVRVDGEWTIQRTGLSYGEAPLIESLRRAQRPSRDASEHEDNRTVQN
ncbi:MAG TPA: replication initiator [Mycobacterium sp.]|nr:replication initiator [Mycobacterium sp.]